MNEIPKNKNKKPPARMPIFLKKDDKLMCFFSLALEEAERSTVRSIYEYYVVTSMCSRESINVYKINRNIFASI